QYSRRFSHPVSILANQYASLLNAIAGAERIFEVLDEPDEVDEGAAWALRAAVQSAVTAASKAAEAGAGQSGAGARAESKIRGEIEFRDIVFSYKAGEPVLKGLNMKIRAGQSVAVAGATGSGKTTLVNLLTRFYEPDSGSVLVDGMDVRRIPKAELRSSMAVVLQETVLFNDTIGNNIRYGRRDATYEEVRAAAAAAMADRFIEQLPDGYDTMLAEAGSNLSQGQRQLLTIARAVLADPKILILDEATSSVDTRTEVMVQKAMDNLMKNRTTIMIAHRLSTIRHADRIDVVGEGRVLESGTHDELLQTGGEYARLYRRQYAGFAT
ncbi:MAG: ATP-binding cassette domain-containing protein, partial [Firmicutes bacterium]|nr:ATP-binding cassette domain-containing protein [Bacillota bacterium]